MRRFLLLLLPLAAIALPAQAEPAPLGKEEVETIVHDYLLAHPEVVMESVQSYQRREEARRREETGRAAKENHAALFNDPASPSFGPKDGKITMVVFFDYNCSACKLLYGGLKSVLPQQKDLRVVFKEFPIFGERSESLARLALAVNRAAPGKYWEFHQALMSHEGPVTPDVATRAIQALGLNVEAIVKDAGGKEVAAALKQNRSLGEKLQIGGTPMVIINDKIIPHALNAEGLKAELKEAATPK